MLGKTTPSVQNKKYILKNEIMNKSKKSLNRRKFLERSATVLGTGVSASVINPTEVFGTISTEQAPRKPKSRYLKYKDKLDHCFSAVLQDVMDGMGVRVQCMDPAIKPLDPSMRTWGEAITIYVETVAEVPEHPFQKEMELLDSANEGHIMVVQCNTNELSAFLGRPANQCCSGSKNVRCHY